MVRKTLILFVLLLFLVSTASAATLNVGPKAKYHTIQSAVKAAKDGDTIKVAPGIYKENVAVNGKRISFQGVKYPTVYGFENKDPSGSFNVNGFKITKYGVVYDFNTPGMLVRNNYFMNCKVSVSGPGSGRWVIMNNQFIGSKAGVSGFDLYDLVITGNRFTKCNTGIGASDTRITKARENIFTQCGTAVKLCGSFGTDLSGFSGNKYIKNKKNFALGDYCY